MLKENGSEYSLLGKIYNALFYSVFVYIHQLRMLSHVKYQNNNFIRIKKSKYYLGTPMLKKISLNIMCPKKYTMLFSTLFGVYTPTQYALSCKKRKLKIYANRKISNYLGTAMLKEKLL